MSTYRPRHRRPSKTKPALAVGSMSTAFVLGNIATASPAGAATAEDFRRLAQCESGGNPRTNTGNGYYGMYQFALGTWRSLGYSGYPHQHSAAVQTQAARRLQAMQGWSPWPGCARMLGLGRTSSGSRSQTRIPARSVPAVTAGPTIQRLKVGTVLKAPAAPQSGFLVRSNSGKARADVKRWQLQMARRGWQISVDGVFGPQSERIFRSFAEEKKLERTVDRTLTEVVWDATWISPVT
jgi:hypothetical protein